SLMGKQLRRWSHGFVQNVKLHWRGLLTVPYLRSAVAVAFWDASLAAAVYLVVLPILAIVLASPWVLIGYVIDAPAVLVPVLAGELLRLWVHGPAVRSAAIEPSEERQVIAAGAGGARLGRILVLVLTATAVPTRAAVAQSGSPVAAHLARADSAFAEGDAAAAAQEYAVVLAADSENSHATYRLAQLRRHDPRWPYGCCGATSRSSRRTRGGTWRWRTC